MIVFIPLGFDYDRLFFKGVAGLWDAGLLENPGYREVMYVEELIGPDSVNTMLPVTV